MMSEATAHTLYHYSKLYHLPSVVREGLRHGVIACPDPNNVRVAVSLTTQPDPDRLACWGPMEAGSPSTAVRYVCEVAGDDPLLEPQRQTWRRLKYPKDAMKALDPYGQAKWWYFYHGVIEQFAVHLRGRSGYRTLAGPELTLVAEAIERERSHFPAFVPPGEPFALDVIPLDPARDPWLLTEPYPADHLLGGVMTNERFYGKSAGIGGSGQDRCSS